MTRALQLAGILALGTFILCAVFLSWRTARMEQAVSDAADAARQKVPDLTATVAKLNQALDKVNQPCGYGKPCGLLATANKTVVKVGDAIVTTQLQEVLAEDSAYASGDGQLQNGSGTGSQERQRLAHRASRRSRRPWERPKPPSRACRGLYRGFRSLKIISMRC